MSSRSIVDPWILPDVPPHYVPRLDLEREIAAWLGDEQRPPRLGLIGSRSSVGTDEAETPGLIGVGTSTLAAAAARQARERFRDGVLWLAIGPEPNIAGLQRTLARALGFDERFASHVQGTLRLRDMFSARNLLLVLDDVHRPEHALAFDVLDGPGRVLITSADGVVVQPLAAEILRVPPLSYEQARTVLLGWSGAHEHPLDATAHAAFDDLIDQIIELCGRLPLMLAPAGAMARERSWDEVRDRIARAANSSPHVLVQLSSYAHVQVLEAAYQGMRKNKRQRYRDLSLVPDDEPIPESVMAALWQRDVPYVHRLLDDLATRGLLARAPNSKFWLHDAHRAFVRARDDDPATRHDRLLDALTPLSDAATTSGSESPDPVDIASDEAPCEAEQVRACDDYLLRRAAYHLIRAQRSVELERLLCDVEWLTRRLRQAGPQDLVEDIDRFMHARDTPTRAPGADSCMSLLRETVRMAGDILSQEPEQLASQIAGRLTAGRQTIAASSDQLGEPSSQGHGACEHDDTLLRLLANTRHPGAHPRLLPITATMAPPAGVADRTILAHDARITDVAVLPDGVHALTASLDRTSRLWDLRTGQTIRVLHGDGGMLCVTVTPDGTRALAGARDHKVYVWDLVDGRPVHILSGHEDSVSAIAVTLDGSHAITGSHDRTLAVWDIATGERVRVMAAHTRPITEVAVTPDGEVVVSSSLDGSVKVWELRTGRQLRRLWSRTRRVGSVALMHPGTRAIAASAGGRVDFWNLDETRPMSTLWCLEGNARTVAMSRDGRRAFAAAESAWLSVLDIEHARESGRLWSHSRGINAIDTTPDGARAITVSDDQTIKIWTLYNRASGTVLPAHRGPVRHAHVAGDGTRAFSVGVDGDLAVWDPARGERLVTRPGKPVRHALAGFTSDGRVALTSDGDRALAVWSAETGARLGTLSGEGGHLRSLAVTRDGAYAVCGARDGAITLWSLSGLGHALRRQNEIRPAHRLRAVPSWAIEVAVTSDARHVLAHTPAGVDAWQCADGRPVLSFTRTTSSSKNTAFAFTDDHAHVLVSNDKRIVMLDVQHGRAVHEFSGHVGAVNGLAVNGTRAVSIARDSRLGVWDLQTGDRLHTLTGDAFGIRTLLGITPDGDFALSQSHGGELTIWELATGRRLHTVRHRAQVTGWLASPDGTRVMTTDRRNVLTVWDLRQGHALATFRADGLITSCALVATSGLIMAGDAFGRVHFLEFIAARS